MKTTVPTSPPTHPPTHTHTHRHWRQVVGIDTLWALLSLLLPRTRCVHSEKHGQRSTTHLAWMTSAPCRCPLVAPLIFIRLAYLFRESHTPSSSSVLSLVWHLHADPRPPVRQPPDQPSITWTHTHTQASFFSAGHHKLLYPHDNGTDNTTLIRPQLCSLHTYAMLQIAFSHCRHHRHRHTKVEEASRHVTAEGERSQREREREGGAAGEGGAMWNRAVQKETEGGGRLRVSFTRPV